MSALPPISLEWAADSAVRRESCGGGMCLRRADGRWQLAEAAPLVSRPAGSRATTLGLGTKAEGRQAAAAGVRVRVSIDRVDSIGSVSAGPPIRPTRPNRTDPNPAPLPTRHGQHAHAAHLVTRRRLPACPLLLRFAAPSYSTSKLGIPNPPTPQVRRSSGAKLAAVR